MSFLRHEEIYQSDVGVCVWLVRGDRSAGAPHLIVLMSFRLAIPWTVALQQSRPPLRQPCPVSERKVWLATIFQRMVMTVTKSCLRQGVQCTKNLSFLILRSVMD
jgi:hypothetical protein